MEIDPKDVVYIRIDRRRKFPVTLLFKAFGYSTEDLLSYFYKTEKIIIRGTEFFREINEEFLKGQRASFDITDPQSGEAVVRKGRMFTQKVIRQMKAIGMELIPVHTEDLINHAFALPVIHPETKELIAKSNDLVDEKLLTKICEAGITQFGLLFIDGVSSSDSIRKTILLDKVDTKEDALIEIYRRLRPGNPATPEVAQDFIDHLFFKSAY
jgi:DNA-directed RNA polymerase subunit beta